MRVCVLDIESQELIRDWNKPWEGGLSVAGVWVSWTGGAMGEFRLYQRDELEFLGDALGSADVVVTKNGARYDLPALDDFLKETPHGGMPPLKHHCDLQVLATEALGYRVSLDNLAWATLRRGKDASGAMAPTLWKEGRYSALHTYNMRDIALTRDLFFFARDYGYLLATTDAGDVRLPMSVPGGVDAWVAPLPSQNRRINYEPATDRQIAAIQRLYGYEWRPTPGFTKVQASELIKSLKEVGR